MTNATTRAFYPIFVKVSPKLRQIQLFLGGKRGICLSSRFNGNHGSMPNLCSVKISQVLHETIIFLKNFKEYLVLPHIFLVTLQVDQRIIFQSSVLFLNLCMPSVFLFFVCYVTTRASGDHRTIIKRTSLLHQLFLGGDQK